MSATDPVLGMLFSEVDADTGDVKNDQIPPKHDEPAPLAAESVLRVDFSADAKDVLFVEGRSFFQDSNAHQPGMLALGESIRDMILAARPVFSVTLFIPSVHFDGKADAESLELHWMPEMIKASKTEPMLEILEESIHGYTGLTFNNCWTDGLPVPSRPLPSTAHFRNLEHFTVANIHGCVEEDDLVNIRANTLWDTSIEVAAILDPTAR